MSILVRRAGRRDLKDIHGLWMRIRELEANADSRLAPAKNAAQIASEHREVILGDPRTAFFVAEDHGAVCGFLHARIEQNDPIYATERYGVIADLFVDEERRGDGIGTRLLNYCLEWFASHGLDSYRIDTPTELPLATRFFERSGAVRLSSRLSAPVP